jgi:uncharacterized membrane protein YphA (DoxX/SURF4 family)
VEWIRRRVARVRTSRGSHVFIMVTRYLLGFAFLPAGLKKVLGQPFTDPDKHGAFHDFLHAFHDTGFFYHAVGAMQLVAAGLLLTQRFALLGTLLLTPILTAIFVFCWSTGVIPTATVVTLMMGALGILLCWDIERWIGLVKAESWVPKQRSSEMVGTLNQRPWEIGGWAIALLFLGNTVITGEVYRPRGAEWHNPSFWVLLAIAAVPFVAHRWEKRERRKGDQ